MKKLLFCILIVLLSGCSTDTGTVKNDIDKVFGNEKALTTHYKNNYTNLMDYYIPSDVSEMNSDEFSVEMEYEGCSIVMNVNVAGIITDKYYDLDELNESLFDKEKLFYKKTGAYVDSKNIQNSFKYQIYSYMDTYLAAFTSKRINIYAYGELEKLAPLTSRILLLAKGASVRDDVIISSYSSKGVIDYQKKQVDLFESILPVNGRIDDMLVKKDDVVEDDVVEENIVVE